MKLCLSALCGLIFGLNCFAAELVKKDVDYKFDGQTYKGYLVYKSGIKGSKPGLLVAHNWIGLSDETKSKADQMAELGYVVFALDIYGTKAMPKNVEEAAKTAGAYKKDRVMLRRHMEKGFEELKKQEHVNAKKIVALGYCFGGTSVLELARSGADLAGVVTFHGGLDSPKPEDGKNIKAKVLVLAGADDPYVPQPDIRAFENEMKSAKVDWQMNSYGNAVHSFTEKAAGNDNSKGAAYNALADERSWKAMKDFLAEVAPLK